MNTLTLPPVFELSEISHPAKLVVPAAEGLAWGHDGYGSGYWTQEKLDGVFCPTAWRGGVVAAEQMRDGRLVAFDMLALAEVGDIRRRPLKDRLTALALAADTLRADGLEVVRSASFADDGNAGQFLARIWAEGGEGAVRKSLAGDWWTPMAACKRAGIWLCRVVDHCGGTQSVLIADAETGADRGKVTLRGGKCEQVRPGSLIRVEGMELTAAGKIREPRPCREWLVQF